MWWALLTRLVAVPHDRTTAVTETVVISPSQIRVESRGAASAPVRPATLKLPAGWSRQDFGNMAGTNTTVWLDWTKTGKNFVPHVLVGDLQASAGYMRGESLQAAVRDRLAGLRAGGATIESSASVRVCRGKRPGWFFSYTKLWDDPPLRFDEALYLADGTITMAIYMRPADQPEDRRTRNALLSLCTAPRASP